MHCVILASFIASVFAAADQAKASRPHLGSFKLSLRRGETGNDTAWNRGPIWESSMTIGGQDFTVWIDTGSADLWVTSVDLPVELQGTHALYNMSLSSTANNLKDEEFNVNYSFEGASGYVIEETVSFGELSLEDMPVGIATHIGPYLVNQKYDGLLGLAFKGGNSIRPHQSQTFMELIEDRLNLPVFTASFYPNNVDGTLEFGYIDKTLYTGDLISAPVNNETSASWTVDNVIMSLPNVWVRQSMLFDTGGANFMWVEPAVADAYWSQVQGSVYHDGDPGYWGFPCDEELPDFELEIGDGKAVIPGRLMSAGYLNDTGALPLCTGALQGRSGRGSVGAPFFEALFVVFNQAEPSISYAPHAYMA